MLGWFQALLPREDKFYDLFERHAETLVAGALAPAGTAIVALSLALGVAIAVGSLARVRVGGITGDVCGAIGEIVFACELVAFSAGHA